MGLRSLGVWGVGSELSRRAAVKGGFTSRVRAPTLRLICAFYLLHPFRHLLLHLLPTATRRLINDNPYIAQVFDGRGLATSPLTQPGAKRRTIELFSFAKSYQMVRGQARLGDACCVHSVGFAACFACAACLVMATAPPSLLGWIETD